jgi:hypothetical protein
MPATWVATRDVPIADLTRYPGNARRGSTGEIRKSIRRHGQYRAIVVRDTGTSLVILAGSGPPAILTRHPPVRAAMTCAAQR